MRFELVRAGASPIQARSASKWNPAFWSLLRRGEAAYGVRELVTAFWPTAARKHPSSRVPDLPTPIRDLRRLVSSTFVVPPSAGFSSSIAQAKNHERHESHEKQSGYRTGGRRGNGDVPCNDECRKSNDERSPKSQIDASPSALAPFRSHLPTPNSQLPFPPARPDLPSPISHLRSSPEGSRPSAFTLTANRRSTLPVVNLPDGIDSESRTTRMGGEGRSLGRARPSITSTSTAIAEHEYEYEVRARARNRNRRSATEAVLGSMFAAGRELGPALRASVFRSRNPGLRLARSSHRLHPGLD